MNLSYLATIFVTVFIAEIGDKTQLAALLFAAKADTSLLGVFLAASAALVLATGLAVLAGGLIQQHLTHIPLKLIAGFGFVAIGLWSIADHFLKQA